jgi:multisubunit Na+/H+ antiporter MnhC subunit
VELIITGIGIGVAIAILVEVMAFRSAGRSVPETDAQDIERID